MSLQISTENIKTKLNIKFTIYRNGDPKHVESLSIPINGMIEYEDLKDYKLFKLLTIYSGGILHDDYVNVHSIEATLSVNNHEFRSYDICRDDRIMIDEFKMYNKLCGDVVCKLLDGWT